MTDLYGATRSVVSSRYALITPEGFVSAPIPGWPGATSIVVISPALGARFAQLHITLGPGSYGAGERADEEFLVFVREGGLKVEVGSVTAELGGGGYAYIPPETPYRLEPSAGTASLLVFQRRYVALPGVASPEPVIGNENEISGAPFLGDEAAILKNLLPDTPSFDMAVNIFTFQPGATLPMVETHIMEHGLLMIQGQGIYRLAGDYHPVQSGDVIWMAPYCPQWFVATGKTPARYIYYKDVNRDPLTLV